MAESIEQLRIYKVARELEDQVYALVKAMPADTSYTLGNDLRCSSAAVVHYIMETHRLYSYRLKLDSLANARREAEATQKHLEAAKAFGKVGPIISEYTGVIKQSWGLSKWLRTKLQERQEKAEVSAKEDMASSRTKVGA